MKRRWLALIVLSAGASFVLSGCAALDTRPDQGETVIEAEPVGVNNDVVAALVKMAQANKKASKEVPPTAPAAKEEVKPEAEKKSEKVAEKAPEKSSSGRAPASVDESKDAKRIKKGATIAYTVKRGDTLMKISFETFGDLGRWREIFNLNKEKVKNPSVLSPGTVLKIYLSDYVVVEKNGKPYLIRRNDTLGKISHGIYGTPSKWKKLWMNNRQLIHDPNKIYAGFYLYYEMNDKDRDEAIRLGAWKLDDKGSILDPGKVPEFKGSSSRMPASVASKAAKAGQAVKTPSIPTPLLKPNSK